MVLVVLGAGLLVAGLLAVAIGILPAEAALALGARIAPVLGFVVAITVAAAIAAEAGVFDRLAVAAARAGRGRAALLWLLVVLVAVVSTVFLSLDTTAVLLTPVVVVLARRAGLSPLLFAMTTVWIANTGSLLLPVSNLTNLLAEGSSSLGGGYAARAWAPALVAVVVPLGVLAVAHRRVLLERYVAAPAEPLHDRVLFGISAAVLALLVPALVLAEPVLHRPVWVPATAAAVVLVVAAALRRPAALGIRLLPLPLLVFVCGLFLAVTAAGRLGLTELLTAAAGRGDSMVSLLRLAGVGTVLANLVDNLPAYLALEPVAGSADRLLALLVAVNAGPLVTPWASLATLLWHAGLRSQGVRISWWRFAGLGLVAAPLTVVSAVLVVPLTR